MKILLLGAQGMLGHKILQSLLLGPHEITATVRADTGGCALFSGVRILSGVDAMEVSRIRELLETERPDVTVNCVGVIKQRTEALSGVSTILVNALLPHLVAETVTQFGGRLIHFSTDCVFDGTRGRYTEDSRPDAIDLYGRTKALGEVTAPHALTLRTSIIGRELVHSHSLLEWFLAQRGRRIRGFQRALWSGVSTNWLAGIVCRIIDDFPGLSGLLQVASDPLSKHDLLLLARSAFGIDVESRARRQ